MPRNYFGTYRFCSRRFLRVAVIPGIGAEYALPSESTKFEVG